MSTASSPNNPNSRDKALQNYYRLHARIYDATRWSFLFGRRAIIQRIAEHTTPKRVLEVGCGTGTNLRLLARQFPQATLTGIDLSADMLRIAELKLADVPVQVELRQQSYPDASPGANPETNQHKQAYDLILFSYSLSMFNPGWDKAIAASVDNLNQGGLIAVVDFHNSRFSQFKRWMALNHVQMEGHLLPELQQQFKPVLNEQRSAYGGLWNYLIFLGRRI